MKYHTSCEHYDVMEIRLGTDLHWQQLVKKFNKQHNVFTDEEILKLLEEIQAYVNFDFPIEKRNCDREVLDAFELVCRVAHSLAVSNVYNKPMDNDYITKKLYSSLYHLALDKSDFES